MKLNQIRSKGQDHQNQVMQLLRTPLDNDLTTVNGHRPAPDEIGPSVFRQMGTVRGAFRCHRQARAHRERSKFYIEHDLFDAARSERVLMIEDLRSARQQWRLILGIEP